jgi:phosphoribosylamine---glycine ligase
LDRVGILVVSKCLSSSAMVDTLLRSERYLPEVYMIEKQPNPFNVERAKHHVVVPDLNLDDVVKAARKLSGEVSFGLVDNEDFVTAGGRDRMETEAGIQMVCVTRKFAIERSKAAQRLLFDRIFRRANPRYRIFDPALLRDRVGALAEFRRAVADFGEVAVKPDAPARGAGVGVWGADFDTEGGMAAFFMDALSRGRVVVEEKVDGEESSFHAFSDGKHFVPAPLTRDYKRSAEGNTGRLTGGMGTYRGPSEALPFLNSGEWEELVTTEESAFRKWKGRGAEPGLRGVVIYDAIMHTGKGFKVLERNSRGGNTEFINILTTMADDFVDVCFRILDGSLKGIRFAKQASVVTCGVPLSYGTGASAPTRGEPLDLAGSYALSADNPASFRVLPMDLRSVDGTPTMGASRAVAFVGLGPSLGAARVRSLRLASLSSGPLRWRRDIASPADISRSIAHMRQLRRTSPS